LVAYQIAKIELRQNVKKTYEQIEQEISKSKVLHIDETSHYNKGKLGWCWMFTSNTASFVNSIEFISCLVDPKGV
jgi:L-fucose mutarotase/ribose pyranase (RbsD/FucU family)